MGGEGGTKGSGKLAEGGKSSTANNNDGRGTPTHLARMGALLGLALPSPVGAQRTQYTCFLCPVRVATAPTGGAPSPPADQSLTVLSSDPEARSAFEGDHLSVLTSSV